MDVGDPVPVAVLLDEGVLLLVADDDKDFDGVMEGDALLEEEPVAVLDGVAPADSDGVAVEDGDGRGVPHMFVL